MGYESPSETSLKITFHPLTAERWNDFEKLFGPRGATGGCWCMYWRLSNKDFEAMKGDTNRKVMNSIVEKGEVPGILAYLDGQPAGWCSIAPRETFPRLENSRVAKAIDDQQVWSVVCFFIHKNHRRMGISEALLKAAINYAVKQGAKIIEGYPVEPKEQEMPAVFAYYGMASVFRTVGFVEVARRSERRPYMRYYVQNY
jgi:GNAT superfamily N-acetyltransferase